MDMYRLKNFLKQNAEREFELEYAHRIINHSQMQFNHHTQRKHHTFKPAFIHHAFYSKLRFAEVKCTRALIL